MNKFSLTTEIDVFEGGHELPEHLQNLLAQAKIAANKAYAPYSHFFVGAALLLENGEVVQGNNQENAAYPSGICAERTAFYWAGASFPDTKIVAVAVVARRQEDTHFIPVTPCGACRQAMSEYENRQQSPIQMLIEGKQGTLLLVPSIASLLPLQFTEISLRGEGWKE